MQQPCQVTAKESLALQRRLRHQLREAEAEAAVSQDWALSMLAAEVVAVEAEGREWYAVTHRQRGQMKEGAAEAEERHNSV